MEIGPKKLKKMTWLVNNLVFQKLKKACIARKSSAHATTISHPKPAVKLQPYLTNHFGFSLNRARASSSSIVFNLKIRESK
ncbi:MAG: hypothetical protein JAY82_02670, partial [Candidatus Thiodiazotropha taylori]|nr:hypothetical protein [Candidatus Thiodiazotropha taylori]